MVKLKNTLKIILMVLLLAGVIGLSFGIVKSCSSDEPDDPVIPVEKIEIDETNIVF